MNIDYLIAEKWSGFGRTTGPVPPALFLLPTKNDDWDSLSNRSYSKESPYVSPVHGSRAASSAIKALTHARASAYNTAWSLALTTREHVCEEKGGAQASWAPP